MLQILDSGYAKYTTDCGRTFIFQVPKTIYEIISIQTKTEGTIVALCNTVWGKTIRHFDASFLRKEYGIKNCKTCGHC